MKENSDDGIEKKVREGLEQLDQATTVRTPEIVHFRQMVARAEEKRKTRERRETFLFFLCTVIILTVETYAFSRSFTFFVIVQLIMLVLFPVVLLFTYCRGKGGDVYD